MAKHQKLLIMFVPANCIGDLQPLDVGFNGPRRNVCITQNANNWLAQDIQRQLAENPDPSKVKLLTRKSDLVQPFCNWIASATVTMKSKAALIRRCWEKTGVLV